MSELRESPSPGRRHCLRDSGSDEWAAEESAGGRSNGQERRESLDVDLETTKTEVQEKCFMEGQNRDKVGVIVDVGDAVGQDLEKESRKEQSPSRKEKNGHRGETVSTEEDGHRGETVSKEEDVQRGETVSREEDVQGGETDSPRGCPREGGSPGRSGRTTEEGEADQKAEEIEVNRPPPAAASTGTGEDMAASSLTPSARIICMQGLLRQRTSGQVEGSAREVRARSAEEQPSQPDQEVSRGLSMR